MNLLIMRRSIQIYKETKSRSGDISANFKSLLKFCLPHVSRVHMSKENDTLNSTRPKHVERSIAVYIHVFVISNIEYPSP